METKKVIIIRYGEIYLKGNNRNYFEKMLLHNIKYAVKNFDCKVTRYNERYFLYDYTPENQQNIIDKLQTVFGIYSLSVADEISTSEQNLRDYFKDYAIQAKTFKVHTKRADKTFPISSMEFNAQIGELLLNNNPNLVVDVHNPEVEVFIDIRETGKSYIFTQNIKALGGMPVGTAGKGLVMLSGGIDSPVAAFKIASRGMKVVGLHFHSFPYTSEQAKQKVIELAKIVRPYTHINTLVVAKFTKIQESIHKYCNEEYTITLMRRFMVRIAESVAKLNDCQAIITGESLGQVASQTVESITSSNSVAKELPIFRPLIAFDKEDIIKIARQIGTFNTSILPYEDCCTVFLPKNPLIKPKMDKVLKEESKLNVEELIQDCLSNLEIIEISDDSAL